MSLCKLAHNRGDDLYGVAFALEAIGNLLGADDSEHHINEYDADGLAHAIVALGAFVKLIGGELCKAFDRDEPEEVALQNDIAPNCGAGGELRR